MLIMVFYKILILSLSGTILFFILSLLKPMTKKLFSPSYNYYLLVMTIITFIVPYGMVMPKPQKALINVQTFIEEKSSMGSSKKQNVIKNTDINNKDRLEEIPPISSVKEEKEVKAPAAETSVTLDFKYVKDRIWIIWILGGILSIVLKLKEVISFKIKLKASSRPVQRQEVRGIFCQCCDQLGVHKKIFLKVCENIGTPMATGVFIPVITIPTEEFDSNTLRMIFIHELMHYKRKDLWVKAMSFYASVLHWFNPVIYMVNKELNKECELSCDWQSVKNMSSDEKQQYGLSILNVIDNSINKRLTLGAGMAASSKNQLKERLFMIKSGKRPKKVITLLALTIAVVLTITVGFITNALGNTKENKSTDDFAVMNKEEGLCAVSLSKPDNEVIIDKDGIFKKISISPDGHNVAYSKDECLYIASIDLFQKHREVIKVTEKVVSYAWANNSNLAYSTEKGGLNGFNLDSKKSSVYIKSEEHYEGLMGDGKGTIYGEVYRCYTKDGNQYCKSKGLISYDIVLGKEKEVVPSKPSNEVINDIKDLGLRPKVAGISKDGNYVYIWCEVNAGSANADGVAFGVYDVKNSKFTEFNREEILALYYEDDLAINPVEGRLPVLNNGGGRQMNVNKTLGTVDVKQGTFTPILPQNMIASNGSTAKGMVTMTPSFSRDGKKVIFSASNANENMQQWHKEPHNIYTVDLDTKKVEKITKDNTFDFAPIYISKGEKIVFARVEEKNNISLWRLQGNKEECIAKGIKLDQHSWFYGHFKLENSLDMYISEK